ncbi:MAG: tail fiber domain-containing protein [Pseudomonadales bacterium]|nr:tail fiber domain-containing protein [Pseudomonadales bacterium]
MTDKERTQHTGSDWPIDPFETSGIQLSDILNRFEDVIMSTNYGDGRPSAAVPGTLWCTQSSGQFSLYLFTGGADILIADTDGIGTDQIDMNQLEAWLNANFDTGVSSFNGRKGDVNPSEGDYSLDQLSDVEVSAATANNVLLYTGNGVSPWVAGQVVNTFNGRKGAVTPTEGDYLFDQLGDVGLSNLQKDDYIQWNGSSWENNPPKLIETELNFMGGYDVTTSPPANPGHGDMYINNVNGNAASGWTGIAGIYVNVGNAVGYSKNHNANGDQVAEGTGGAWFLLGNIFEGGVTGIGQGSGITVDSSSPTQPVVSVNRTTTDQWYAAKGHLHTGVYEPVISKNSAFNKNFGGSGSSNSVARSDHNHTGVYQPVGDYVTGTDLSGYATQSWVSTNYATSGHGHLNYADKVHYHNELYMPLETQRSAYNKDFGSARDQCARGDHSHDYQPIGTVPSHTHNASQITAGTFGSGQYTFPSHLYISGYCEVTSVVRSKSDVVAYYSSDSRLKSDVKPIQSALAKILSLKGVEFEWNERQDTYQGADIGVIAQDVLDVFPSLVGEQSNGFLGVKYEKLVAPMIESIRELSEEVRKLKAEVAELKGDKQ